MDGIHDIGGRHGFGPIAPERDEPAFHERWEARVFSIMRAASAAGVVRNTDQFRHAIERIDPIAYLTHGYYGRWLGGLETLLTEAGVISRAQLTARVAELGGDPQAAPAARPAAEPDVIDYVASERDSRRAVAAPPRFAPGARVRTQATPKPGHTRLPTYARGRVGTVIAWHDGWVFPDSNAHGRGENPQHLYTVAFAGDDLWGEAGEPGLTVHLDLFESYLEAQ
ncbi:MAG: nitrile hydratase subunit beta [Pseudomonadales bacterium]